MWKYIITGYILVSTPCPQNLEGCTSDHLRSKFIFKEFFDRKTAIEFHDKGNMDIPNGLSIDSVFVELKKTTPEDGL